MADDTPVVLVTGASGYIATHIVQQLQQSGKYKVRGTVRSTKNEEKVAPLLNLCPDAKYPLELVEGNLQDEEPWKDAVKGCTYVLHTASPFPASNPKHEDEVIKPAVEGTLNVLKACKESGCVKRVVLTSSIAAVSGGFDFGGEYSESDWLDTDKPGVQPYVKSKALAEKAAWEYMKSLPDNEKFELAVVNPAFVVGPALCGGMTTSQEIPKMLLEHGVPTLPKLNWALVDVRDVAKSHINAMTVPEAVNNRHLLHSGNIWFIDMAKILEEEFKPQGYKIPHCTAPSALVKFGALFSPALRFMLPSLDKVTTFKSDRMEKVLGVTPIPIKRSVIEMAYSMIEAGKVKKTAGYKGPK